MSRITVLCVDGDDDARRRTAAALSDDDDVTALGAPDAAAARERLSSADVDCVVTEYDLPDGTGLDLLADVREAAPDTACVLFTDREPSDVDTASFEGVIAEYLKKGGDSSRQRLREMIEALVTLRTQVGYPLPDDEDARLAALRTYDVEPEAVRETLDRLTELARLHFEVDVAFLGLVADHEETFVACHGGEMEPLAREDAMCTHAILEDDVLVVPDVREDPRFEHNDALAALDIVSYAGAPLRTSDGAAIGSLCVTHDEPRTYTDDEVRFLRLLADEAMEQLELRRRLDAGDARAAGTTDTADTEPEARDR